MARRTRSRSYSSRSRSTRRSYSAGGRSRSVRRSGRRTVSRRATGRSAPQKLRIEVVQVPAGMERMVEMTNALVGPQAAKAKKSVF